MFEDINEINVSEMLTASIVRGMKRRQSSMKLYGALSQKTLMFILATLRTQSLTLLLQWAQSTIQNGVVRTWPSFLLPTTWSRGSTEVTVDINSHVILMFSTFSLVPIQNWYFKLQILPDTRYVFLGVDQHIKLFTKDRTVLNNDTLACRHGASGIPTRDLCSCGL